MFSATFICVPTATTGATLSDARTAGIKHNYNGAVVSGPVFDKRDPSTYVGD